MTLDVLAIAAHPDDIELSCSATLAKLIRAKRKAGILDLTEGELGTRGSRETRRLEARRSPKILGLHVREQLGLPDGNITIDSPTVTRLIQVIRTYRPTVLLIPHWLERHPDHEHAHALCREAWFYAGLEKIRTAVNGKNQEPFRPKRYFHYMQKYEFTPSFIVDVSATYDVKRRALKAFSSQFYNPTSRERQTLLSSKLFLESIEARDRHFGGLIDSAFGEAFYSIEPIALDSFFSLRI
jgi:bacillithiol biosynthesis deacetylase BshB1